MQYSISSLMNVMHVHCDLLLYKANYSYIRYSNDMQCFKPREWRAHDILLYRANYRMNLVHVAYNRFTCNLGVHFKTQLMHVA